MMRRDDLDWPSIAETGDAGAAIPGFVIVPGPAVERKWRPSLFTILVFTAWALWEVSGALRVWAASPAVIEEVLDLKNSMAAALQPAVNKIIRNLRRHGSGE